MLWNETVVDKNVVVDVDVTVDVVAVVERNDE